MAVFERSLLLETQFFHFYHDGRKGNIKTKDKAKHPNHPPGPAAFFASQNSWPMAEIIIWKFIIFSPNLNKNCHGNKKISRTRVIQFSWPNLVPKRWVTVPGLGGCFDSDHLTGIFFGGFFGGWQKKTSFAWQVFVPFLGWLRDPLKG